MTVPGGRAQWAEWKSMESLQITRIEQRDSIGTTVRESTPFRRSKPHLAMKRSLVLEKVHFSERVHETTARLRLFLIPSL